MLKSVVITLRVMTCSELSKKFAGFEAFSEVITRSVMTTLAIVDFSSASM